MREKVVISPSETMLALELLQTASVMKKLLYIARSPNINAPTDAENYDAETRNNTTIISEFFVIQFILLSGA